MSGGPYHVTTPAADTPRDVWWTVSCNSTVLSFYALVTWKQTHAQHTRTHEDTLLRRCALPRVQFKPADLDDKTSLLTSPTGPLVRSRIPRRWRTMQYDSITYVEHMYTAWRWGPVVGFDPMSHHCRTEASKIQCSAIILMLSSFCEFQSLLVQRKQALD